MSTNDKSKAQKTIREKIEAAEAYTKKLKQQKKDEERNELAKCGKIAKEAFSLAYDMPPDEFKRQCDIIKQALISVRNQSSVQRPAPSNPASSLASNQ